MQSRTTTAVSRQKDGSWLIHALANDGTVLCGKHDAVPDPIPVPVERRKDKRIICRDCDWFIKQIETAHKEAK